MKGAQTWTLENKNNMEQRKSFVFKQMYFHVTNDNAIAWEHIKLTFSAV
jgi:hypothetical protein